MTEQANNDNLSQAIDTIERGYEFLLAYAAQGRRTDKSPGAAEGPRPRLNAMAAAITGLPALFRQKAEADSATDVSDIAALLEGLERDAAVSAAAIRLVLGRPDISSQLVDNLNASIHLRALLTDMFLLDEALGG